LPRIEIGKRWSSLRNLWITVLSSRTAHWALPLTFKSVVPTGDTARAKAAYQDFLTLWKDADPEIPIYKQAKAEHAKLQ
jgi:hypothetical protein